MSGSGGSVSDAPTNKTVSGQRHHLAYITPDEVNTLVDQGGVPTMTNEGIMAYPPQGQSAQHGGTERSSTPSTDNSADRGGNVHRATAQSAAPVSNVHQTGAVTQTPGKTTDTTETKDSLITKVKNKVISKFDATKIASKLGWVTDNSFMNALGGAVGVIGLLGTEAQSKAINWDLNRKLTAVGKQKDFHPGSHSMQIQDLQDKIERANLDPDHPDHYGQTEYMEDYPGVQSAPDDGGNSRGLTNIITPYAAHAIGGTTQQTSQAAQWYANLGSGNSNPGAFDLTAQYAKAKAAVSQTLQNPSSVGQVAVADSAFFNFLKDNSLNKGIL